MNESQDFQDAESIRSGNTHVTSRPVSFLPQPTPEGKLRHSFVTPKPQRRAPKHLGHGFSGDVFCKSRCVIISTLSTRIESMEFVNSKSRSIHPQYRKSEKARTKSRSEMPVRTVSQRFSHPQWRRLFKELWGRPTTTADFWIFTLTSSLHQLRLHAGR